VTTASVAAPHRLKTTVDLIDLGEKDPRSAGIWSPDYHDSVVKNFIHDQFLDDADTYVSKYTKYDWWRPILAKAQRFLNLPATAGVNILDLGSGAGNTVFPLLDLYPNATVVASDLSVPLLRVLRKKQIAEYSQADCLVMQLNAEELVFEDGQFDLVVGAAILHHLFDPEKSIREAHRVLKPGGFALFFEPFEAGQQIIALALKHMVSINDLRRARNSGGLISADVLDVFTRLRVDFEVRKGSDKSGEVYRRIDDKWLFTRSYLERIASRCGFADLAIYPLYGIEKLFSTQVSTYLRLCLGKDLTCLPDWAQQVLFEYDQHFSADARQDLILEGGVVLKK
jgi:ubiquinone/menaquinone biosynthesis C-methylase UbiE